MYEAIKFFYIGHYGQMEASALLLNKIVKTVGGKE